MDVQKKAGVGVGNVIDSATKRAKLVPSREPYWVRLGAGAFLGFRKLQDGAGTWVARWRDDDGKQHYRALGHHDEFRSAEKQAREWFRANDQGARPKVTSVDEVCRAYVDALRLDQRGATAKDAEGRFTRLVYGTTFGRIELDRLKTSDVRRWLGHQIKLGEDEDDEDLRKKKDSANRNLASLKAALNFALADRLVATDAGWGSVKSFEKVAQRRQNAFLSLADRTALLKAMPDDLHLLSVALLLTGARPGELAAMSVSDFDRKMRTVTLRGKTGARTVAVSTQAAAFFVERSKDKVGAVPMLPRADGARWDRHWWKKLFRKAVKDAGLPATVVLYALRHTAISEMIMAGMDSLVVAKLTGTSVVMIERHYGNLRHDVVRAKLDTVRAI